jgi:hypothetical protein
VQTYGAGARLCQPSRIGEIPNDDGRSHYGCVRYARMWKGPALPFTLFDSMSTSKCGRVPSCFMSLPRHEKKKDGPAHLKRSANDDEGSNPTCFHDAPFLLCLISVEVSGCSKQHLHDDCAPQWRQATRLASPWLRPLGSLRSSHRVFPCEAR